MNNKTTINQHFYRITNKYQDDKTDSYVILTSYYGIEAPDTECCLLTTTKEVINHQEGFYNQFFYEVTLENGETYLCYKRIVNNTMRLTINHYELKPDKQDSLDRLFFP